MKIFHKMLIFVLLASATTAMQGFLGDVIRGSGQLAGNVVTGATDTAANIVSGPGYYEDDIYYPRSGYRSYR
ncbi:MAG: hypothetical protein P4L22_01610 [Candidatus Babeliales bacterium]|nr:hypothetical protein [Candidatus Babeliales bacterium]